MDKIRVFLIDDSSVVRRLVTGALNRDPALEVVGTAADGRIALSRLEQLNPDVIILDLEMPEMDGIHTLIAIRKIHPRLPIIMFSRFTQRGVEATVHALTLGANDYVPKPGDGLDVEQCIEKMLIPKIKLFGGCPKYAEQKHGQGSGATLPARSKPDEAKCRPPVEIVAIGASTGGPNALAELLPALPSQWAIPILIVQHMPADFTARLAERLTAKTQVRVQEGVAGEPLTAAQAWVAPGNYHMVVYREGNVSRLALNQDPPVNSCRPSVDVLFRSVAEHYGPSVLAVLLTGMGQDGFRGCECIRAAGGQILVQDQASCVVWSMAGSVACAGLADQVMPLDLLGPEIVRRCQPRRQKPCGP